MYSDTHCHFAGMRERGENLRDVIRAMLERSYEFVLDVGTRSGDLSERLALVAESSPTGTCPPFIHFSCGIWPDASAIADRERSLAELEADVVALFAFARHRGGVSSFAALGECGLDRYWNGSDVAAGEEALFCAQLELAKKYSLPVIVHSRDAFDSTLGCIRDSGIGRGVIHCFSYGKDEARAFIDLGWRISFPGTITWPKKQAERDRVAELVRYVPRDRLLLETDAPYLAPAPARGKTNTPLLIEHTYECAARMLGMDASALALVVTANARELFVLDL